MNEAETRAEYIDPALREAGWGVVEDSFVRREYPITIGRLIGNGRRSNPVIADYVLQYRNRNLAVIEAKAMNKNYTEGVSQAKEYAGKMNVRFAYSTNGMKIYHIDMKTGKERDVSSFPTPDELWKRTFGGRDRIYPEGAKWRLKFLGVPFENRGGTWQPRYYQEIAVNNAMGAIAKGKKRILLTLATGTGKTAIAFQIVWKLFHTKWNINQDGIRTPRVLFLADRNILADQAFNAFSAFEEDALVRIRPDEIRNRGKVPTNGSIFFTIFQTFMSGETGDNGDTPYFGDYPKDFFDFIVIDECHRGGAKDESSWRAIMEYFSPAVQLGLTATPKRDHNADTYKYFGEPVYVYSLKDGINDGFLTPFKVVQFTTNIDEYAPTSEDIVKEGEIEEGRIYKEDDFNRIIEIRERENYRVNVLLKDMNQNQKTIVFCASQLHALVIRDLINQNSKSNNPNYCQRVTANEGLRGEQYLREFQDNEKTIPTVLTTSRKLSTGVDALEIRNIGLLRPINSMIEFKQIIGRGTRLFDGKDYFTIYDFVKAHYHFSDPEWDGEPIEVETREPGPEPQICPVCNQKPCICPKKPEPVCEICGYSPCRCDKKPRIMAKVVLSDGTVRQLQHMVSTYFWSPDGKPISATEFLTTLFGSLPELFKDEDELRAIWSKPDTRRKLLQELDAKGFDREQLNEFQKVLNAENSDLYDVLAYVAFHSKIIERSIRAAKANIYLESYDPKQQEFLNFVLKQYVKDGVDELDDKKLSTLLQLKYRAITDAKRELGDIEEIRNTFIGFQPYLYS